MRILLDHCVDWRLKRFLPAHDVKSAQEMGWDALKNGKLLAEAAGKFDVILTVDQNIKHQQNVDRLPIAVVVMAAQSNRIEDLQKLIPAVERCLTSLNAGALVEIDETQTVTVVAAGRAIGH
jgi:predicted nuclease of predicted toxin-antitoxin system